MKVLVIDEEFPYPLNSGKRIRTFNLIRRLAERHEIIYLCRENLENNDSVKGITIRRVSSPIPRKSGPWFYIRLALNLTSRLPYVVSSHYSDDFEHETLKLAQAVDVVHCEWTPYAWSMRKLFPCPSVLATHNVESQIWERYYRNENNPFKKFYIHQQWQKLTRFEKWACSQFSQITAVSEKDKKTLEQQYGTKNVTVVPNGVDVNYFAPQESDIRPYNMVFTGSMDWRPNQDAVVYFLDSIYPLIQKNLPEVSFTVVGRNPPAWLATKGKGFRNVEFTGTVDDVRPYIARSSLYIVPLRIGGGSRLKILEALAMSKPVLSTTIGAEGLKVKNGETIAISDVPFSFAITAIEMMKRPERCAYLGENGRHLVVKEYSWDSIAVILEKVWCKAASLTPARQGCNTAAQLIC
jgi:glycosyltransferase involved in cell wall biosynthesis